MACLVNFSLNSVMCSEEEPKKYKGWGPETLPLKTVEELKSWRKDNVPPELRGADLIENPHRSDWNHCKTLICHDMKGGYLGDRFSGGELLEEGDVPFRFVHWWYTDIFVYFSHNLVTIPPKGWITAGHKSGTQVLGTFITEWDEGSKICDAILSDEALLEETVEKLGEIAATYNFDGWLVNIENEIKKRLVGRFGKFQRDQLPMLQRFLRELRNKCRNVLGSKACAIWYDSVIASSGRLKWQDELNQLNSPFFDCCDAIFLNYGWKSSSLEQTLDAAERLGRRRDIFVGVDVFGRGCFGGGGFKTALALEVIAKFRLSVAIFAPGWVYEKYPGLQFPRKNLEFWGCLQSYLDPRPIRTLPLVSSFGIGMEMKDGAHCYDLCSEEIQPNFLSNHSDLETGPHVLNEYSNGRSCLQLHFMGRPYLTLFETELSISERSIVCCFTADGLESRKCELIVQVRDRKKDKLKEDETMVIPDSSSEPEGETSAVKLHYVIPKRAHSVLRRISVSVPGATNLISLSQFEMRHI